jgi:multidrug transporter EmrE-like cation transporter
VSLSVQLGLLLSLATAFTSVLGFLYKHRGAVESPEVSMDSPIRSSLALFRNRWYVLGIVIAVVGWGFHVGALALAPISIVQATIAGGLVLLTVTADRLFGHSVTRREWFGVGLAAIGLAFLAATIGDTADEAHSDYDPADLIPFLIIVSVAACAIAVRAGGRPREGVLLGASAGLFWAASDTSIKALSSETGNGIAVLIDPLAFLILIASLVGLAVSARSLQVGKAVPVIAVTSVAANSLTILAGPIVFREPLPDGGLAIAVRALAFLLVIGAAALTPAPVAAAEGSGEA